MSSRGAPSFKGMRLPAQVQVSTSSTVRCLRDRNRYTPMSHPTTTSTANTMPRIAGTESCADAPDPEPVVGAVVSTTVEVVKELDALELEVTDEGVSVTVVDGRGVIAVDAR